jgi:GNAT superfamily N-acetyltransferase
MSTPPGSPLALRSFSAPDYADWLPIWKKYQSFYKTAIPEETSRVSFSRMLDPAEPMFGAFAINAGRILGFAHWIFHRSNWTIGDYCYLQDLYVEEDARGLGVGRSLIEHVYAEAKQAGCSRVHWLTHESNAHAMLLYDRIAERSGFVQYRKPL